MSAAASFDLTTQEQGHVRTALKFLRARFGGWRPLAKVLHFGESSVGNMAAGHRTPTIAVAFRIARLVKVPVDDVLAGRFPPAGTCPHCGHRKDD
jgi:DNA-binding XRE family transcriptional regulator